MTLDEIRPNGQTVNVCGYYRKSSFLADRYIKPEIWAARCNDIVKQHQNWCFVTMYSDADKRQSSFLEMMKMCEQGKYDLILVPSITVLSDFWLDRVHYTKRLREMNPPIGIFYVYNELFSLKDDWKAELSLLSLLADIESEYKSRIKHDDRLYKCKVISPHLGRIDING